MPVIDQIGRILWRALIQCRAYGFKSFENYRLRVIAECG